MPVDLRRLEVSALLTEWSDESGWEAKGQFFSTRRAELMASDVKPMLAADDIRAVALTLEEQGRPAAAVKPASTKVWDREKAPQGPLGGEFVFNYLAAEAGTERVRWDGLLWSAMVAGKLSLDQTLHLVAAVGDKEHAVTDGQVFKALAMLLRKGGNDSKVWEKARSMVTWTECKLTPEQKWAWFQRFDDEPALTASGLPNVDLVDQLANVIADCI
jgi:hypothetical protein